MSELPKLVQRLHIESPKRNTNRQEAVVEGSPNHGQNGNDLKPLGCVAARILDIGAVASRPQYTASMGVGASTSFVEHLQRRLRDPTSQVVPNPPLDLYSKIAELFRSPEIVSDQVTREPKCRTDALHVVTRLPAILGPPISIHSNRPLSRNASRSWTTTSPSQDQDLTRQSNEAAEKVGQTGTRSGVEALQGSSVADLSDNSSVPSFNTKPVTAQRNSSKASRAWEAAIADAERRLVAYGDWGEAHSTGDQHVEASGAWEAAIANADQRLKAEQQQRCEPSPRRPRLGLEQNTILGRISTPPIPLDYYRPPPPNTPSISTHGSKLDHTSPSFPKSVEAKSKSILERKEVGLTKNNLREVSDLPHHETLPNSRVEEWLDNTEAIGNQTVEDIVDLDSLVAQGQSFFVWSEDKEAGEGPSNPRPQMSSQLALRDVSNLRRPGYLESNSFFQEREKASQPTTEFMPDPARAAAFERTLARLEGRR